MTNNKVIYRPQGRAQEYSQWACNLYIGCSNQCAYCYLKHGLSKATLGGDFPVLKKGAGEIPIEAYDRFKKELFSYREAILKCGEGLFFTFTSDPCLRETTELSWKCVLFAVSNGVPCVILTKRADFLGNAYVQEVLTKYPSMVKLGWSLTGHDELESGASPTSDRLAAMRIVHERGIYTWASLEPMISIAATREMLHQTLGICCHWKIGLVTGVRRSYTPAEIKAFQAEIDSMNISVYWKESVTEYIKKV